MHSKDTKVHIAPRKKVVSLPVTQEWRLILSFVVIALLMVGTITQSSKALAHTTSASTTSMPAYSCGDLSKNHCYGVAEWDGTVSGGFTSISVTQLHADAPNAIMNNSLWIGNKNYSQWVEAGYAVIYGTSHEFWYWAYIDDSGKYHEYDSNGIVSDSNGDFGHQANVYIWNVGGNTWNAAIYGNASSWLPNGFSLNLSGYVMQIGQEMGGTSGAAAGTATWTGNEWRGGSTYSYQSRAADKYDQSNPPYSNWNAVPNGSNQGGNWWASCC